MSLSAKIGLPRPWKADFYNRFYPIFLKNEIKHCIEGIGGITQFRPTPYLDKGADSKSCARGVSCPFCCVAAETATSSSPRSMSCMHNHHYVAQIVVSCGIGHIPVRLEVLITWSRPNSDLQRVGSGLLKNHKISLFVWKFHSTFANWYGLFKRTFKVTVLASVGGCDWGVLDVIARLRGSRGNLQRQEAD